jgi:hypothetical protein
MARNKPFVMVFWSRDPDGTQHNHRDNPQRQSSDAASLDRGELPFVLD